MENNNFVQVRFKSLKTSSAFTMILHNTRKVDPGHLRDCMAHNIEKNTIGILENDELKIYDIENYEIQTLVNDKLKKQLKDLTTQEKKETKAFRETRHAIVQDSIITLSNSINDMYERNEITKQEINKMFIESLKDIEKETGMKMLNFSIHYDEKTPHVHASFKNYYNGKSITNTLKKQYSKLQDVAAKPWEKIGFVRGISKTITNAKHLSVAQMHVQEIKQYLKEKIQLEKDLLKYKNDKIKQEQDYKDLKDKYDKTIKLFEKFETILLRDYKTVENIKDEIRKVSLLEKSIKEFNEKSNSIINKFIINSTSEIQNLSIKDIEKIYEIINHDNSFFDFIDDSLKEKFGKDIKEFQENILDEYRKKNLSTKTQTHKQ